MVQLSDAVDQLTESCSQRDDNDRTRRPWAVVLSGEGGHFCAGADLSLALEHVTSHADAVEMSKLMSTTLDQLRALPLLSISAVDGHAVGGGAELSTATDWRCLASNARIHFVQARMGVSTGWGGAARLTTIVGKRATALRLLLHSPRLDADAAMTLGLADAVGGDGETASDAAVRLLLAPAHEVAASEEAVRAIKTAVGAASATSEETVLAETAAFGATWGGDANREALAAATKRLATK